MTIYEDARYQVRWHQDNGRLTGATDLILAALEAGEATEAKLAEAERERDRLRIYEPRLMSATVEGDEVRITARAPVAADLALSLAEVLAQENAPNYAEVKVTHPERGVFAVIVQRCEGSTPAELRRKAEERALELEARAAAAESREKALRDENRALRDALERFDPLMACDYTATRVYARSCQAAGRRPVCRGCQARAALAAGEETP